MPDVYLLTTGPEGELAVPHLTLTFLDSGLVLDKVDGERVWDCDWAELEEMSPVERSVLPDGRAGVVIVVVERGSPGSPPLRAGNRRRARHGDRSQGPRRRARCCAARPGQRCPAC